MSTSSRPVESSGPFEYFILKDGLLSRSFEIETQVKFMLRPLTNATDV